MLKYLIDSYYRYPLMRQQDFVKQIFQAEFGCEHCLGANNENIIKDECSNLTASDDIGQMLFDQISSDFARVNLVPFVKAGYNCNTLSDMMKKVNVKGSAEGFNARLGQFVYATENSLIDLDVNAVKRYVSSFVKPAPVHHSVAYRLNYRPHYRVVYKRHAVLLPLISAIDNLLYKKLNVVVAIDGKCGSGKSFYADVLSRYYNFCTIIHCDDFFLPPEMRTRERLSQVGGNIDYERLAEVLKEVRKDKPFTYRRYSCSDNVYYDVNVNPKRLIVVEGSYSLHPALRSFYDLETLLTVSDSEQRIRLLQREGREKFRAFAEKWIPLENRYFDSLSANNAIIIDTDDINYN